MYLVGEFFYWRLQSDIASGYFFGNHVEIPQERPCISFVLEKSHTANRPLHIPVNEGVLGRVICGIERGRGRKNREGNACGVADFECRSTRGVCVCVCVWREIRRAFFSLSCALKRTHSKHVPRPIDVKHSGWYIPIACTVETNCRGKKMRGGGGRKHGKKSISHK